MTPSTTPGTEPRTEAGRAWQTVLRDDFAMDDLDTGTAILAIEAEARASLDDHDIERMARQHFESRRHFFEDTTARGICSECGESDEQDFVRVTMHFTDGDA